MTDDRLPTQSGNAVTVRGLTPQLKARLRVRAAHNGRSMEAEARAILEAALSAPDDETTDLGAFARGLVAPIGGIDLALPSRGPQRQPPELGEDIAAMGRNHSNLPQLRCTNRSRTGHRHGYPDVGPQAIKGRHR